MRFLDDVLLAIIALSCASVVANGAAQAAGDPVSGKEIAGRRCAQCHLVDGGRARAGSPPLSAIARDPSWTGDRLAAFLAKPHGGARELSLSRQESDDLFGYVRSLAPR